MAENNELDPLPDSPIEGKGAEDIPGRRQNRRPAGTNPMDKVFLSYAREDIEFVRRLDRALEERGRKTWVDWKGIPPTDRWLTTIRAAIDEADAFVFVISPASVASQVCQTELDHAISRHKRLVPLVYREPEPGAVRSELAELNYIFARETDSFDEACDRLLTALDTDLDWVRTHTRLLVRAAEWEREGNDASFTLRGRDLGDFEEWLARSPEKEPAPTQLQTEYLLASRRAVTRRQRIIATSVAVGLSLAVGLGTIAYFQNRERVRQETIAEARQLLNRADALREGSLDEIGAREWLEESTRSAATALATLHGLGIPSIEADQSVRRSYAVLPKWAEVELGPGSIEASSFDATGAHLALFQRPGELTVLDVARRRETASCAASLGVGESALAVAVSADAAVAATAVYNANPDRGDTEVAVWSLPDCRATFRVQLSGRRARMALSGNGRYLAVDTGTAVRHWDLASGSELLRDFADLVFAFAFSPDGDRLATVERNRGERVYRVRLRDLGGEGIEREWEHPERAEWVQWGPQALVVGGQAAWLYDPESGDLRHRHPLEQSPFALSPDGRLIAISLPNYIIEIRNLTTGASVERTSYGSDVSALAFGPDSRSLTTVSPVERNVRVWLFESDGAFATLSHAATPLTVRFSSDGAHLYAGTDAGEVGWRLPGPGAQTVSRSPEPTPAPAGRPGTARIELPRVSGCGADSTRVALQLQLTGVEPRRIEVEGAPLSAALNAEGNRAGVLLATGSTRGGCARRLEIWNLETEMPAVARDFGPLVDHGAATLLQFIGDDNYLVVAVRGGVEIVEAADLTSLATLYHAGVARAAIQPGGTLAATQGEDGLVRIWDVETLSEIARIESSPSTAALALSPDDRWLATLEPPDAVRLWAVAPDELIQQACRWLAEPCP